MMTMPKCSSGVIFKHDKSYAVAQTWSNLLCLWVCRYLYTPTQFLASDEMVYENMIKETDKGMKLEYKFYEKNLAPKWLEGDYDLHIEGNRMTMTSKDGKQVEARCHPDDDWRLQVGIDELKDRMAEAKKPREIKVGDKVKFKHNAVDWCKTNHISVDDVMTAYASNIIFGERDYELEDYRFRVVTVAKHKNQTLAYIMDVNNHYSFIVDVEWLELVE